MKYVDIRDLPPCAFSPQCLRLLDDLDGLPTTARAPAQLSSISDLQDARQVRQLRSHVSSCSTCSALLAEARHTRTQQRMMLHHFLIANEHSVPATTDKIFVALRREQAQQERENGRAKQAYVRVLATPTQPRYEDAPLAFPLTLQPRTTQPRSLGQHLLTLATVIAVILAAVGLLNRGTNPATTNTGTPTHPQQPEPSGISNGAWNSVIIGLTLISATGLVKSFTIYNFNTTNEQMGTVLTSSEERSDLSLEEISQDGQNLLYTVASPSQQTTYSTFSTHAGVHAFYHMGTYLAGNALWMDADHVLAQNRQGFVLNLDVHSNVVQQTWPLKAAQLTFYHAPFLYFTHTEDGATHALYRLNLAQSNAAPQQVTAPLPNTRFWLSPNGSTIFYTRESPSDEQGTYAIGSDGTHERLVHSGPGIPIGYAEDDSLMLAEQAGQKIQIVKLGTTVPQEEQVMFADAAPQATSLCGPTSRVAVIALCDQNIALAPYGHGLVLHAYYADGSHDLVYDDLTSGVSRKILSVPEDTSVQLPGWSRLPNAA